MALPIHTAKHIQTTHEKFQIIATVCTAVAIIAAMVTVLSAIHLQRLQKEQQKVAVPQIEPAPTPLSAPTTVDEALTRKIKNLETQIAAEKSASQALKSKIKLLEKKIAALKSGSVSGPMDTPRPNPPSAPR